ncbi:MAG: mannose-1-phosphate guanylyltransferase [Bacteroidota bacterium]|nr:mannose-1-phosphate guanylyltransferase [Bacteroidota bacterium]
MQDNNFCVIMAGGIGTRFWPLSRAEKPKQFLDILGTGKSLIQQTVNRFKKVCPPENIYIVTNDKYTGLIKEQLPEIKAEQILSEPLRRNTAPCAAYANMKIRRRNPEARIITTPSDHLILDEQEFIRVINRALEFAGQKNGLLTLGITPSRPETGYGYIQMNNSKNAETNPDIKAVKTFTEKPDKKTAQTFIDSGEFLWNSGIFIWSLKTIDASFNKYLPDISALFSPSEKDFTDSESERNFIERAYSECKNISIDNGIMEHAENVYVMSADFGWSDLGTWDSLYMNLQRDDQENVISPKHILTYDTERTLVNLSEDKFAVIQGLKDYIVAESDNMLLICQRDDEKRIRDFVNDVKVKRGQDFV